MNSSAEAEQERAGGRGRGEVKHIREWERHEKTEVGSPPDRRPGMGAAPRVLCAQSCQRSPGRIVEEAAASR